MLGFFFSVFSGAVTATLIALAPAAAVAAEPATVDTSGDKTIIAPVQTTDALDARINNLQSSKDCIRNAKTKADIEQCRRLIQIKRDRVNVH